ncbi:hypothetical protein SDC9_160394 [bioreactor metagenome]|uniref:Uncharacterized protein n=1 Tax=bioreactor metagenome TaxID=1076179 RepID=A0A645FKY0_9ZZZZ
MPPFVAVAVKVTGSPEHTAPEGIAETITLTGATIPTFIVIAFDVAGLPVTQVSSEVITQLITFPSARVVLV